MEEFIGIYVMLSNTVFWFELIDSMWGGSSWGFAFPFLDDGFRVVVKFDISVLGVKIRFVKVGIGNVSVNNIGMFMVVFHISGVMVIFR